MKIYKIKINLSINIGKINLAIGNFDGLHLGHQELIKILVKKSKFMNIDPALMSFVPHPRKFFSNKYENFNIISEELKIKLLKQLGIKHFILLEFDQSIASLTPEKFIEMILVKKMSIQNLFIGNDFKFGKDRKGNVELLKQKSLDYDFKVNVIDPVKSEKNSLIFSSSLIRKYLNEGSIENVNLFLGRNWSMSGIVIEGDKRARKMNFPTANIIPPNLIHPKKGVYIVKILYEQIIYSGIANFGERPTVDGKKLLLEAHLFDFNLNIYGKNLTVEFLAFIREEIKFESFDKLVQQVHKDIQIAKDYHLKN